MACKVVIKVPVADLRREPVALQQEEFVHDELRETQLLYGERGELLHREGEWLKIAALEQLCFDETRGWFPYCGWVHHSEAKEVASFSSPKKVVCTPSAHHDHMNLSYGTLITDEIGDCKGVRSIPNVPCRKTLVEEAKLFLGAPYLWGGRAFPLQNTLTSVDCSGLINLLYRAQGIILPRNAHEQYLKSKPIPHLQPGDPLYLARGHRITHVILKLDEETFIESPQTGESVRLLKQGKEIWEDNGKIWIAKRPHPYIPYPSTHLIYSPYACE